MQLNRITKRSEKFEQWYTDVVLNAKLMKYGAIAGTMIIRPNGWKIWELIQSELNKQFFKLGVQNVSMPLLIPIELFNKEKEHIEGFAPELFTVTKVGNADLATPYAIRPTSEVLFSTHFSEIVQSHKDLPLLYNQWCSVMRAEKTTRPFLRSSEFHWQEGHTVHSSSNEAKKFSKKIWKVYENFALNTLCIPVVAGEKTINERFAGAENTYSIEAIMQDGKALQCGTSHYFGQNFTIPYDIKFQNKNNILENAYQTSWGISTRLIGAIIMTHGDDRGLVLPPAIAPTQISVLTLFAEKNVEVANTANNIYKMFKNTFRTILDNSEKGIGFKLAEQEIIGTPIRIEIGPRDLANNIVIVSRRDNDGKVQVKLDELKAYVKETLKSMQKEMLIKKQEELKARIKIVNSFEEFKIAIKNGGFVLAPWSGNAQDEVSLKEQTFATARCIDKDKIAIVDSTTKCFFTNKPAKKYVYFAIAY